MAPRERPFGSDNQPQNQLPFSETNPSQQSPSSQDAQYITDVHNNNLTNSVTSFDERSLINGVNSSLQRGSLPQQPGLNRAESRALQSTYYNDRVVVVPRMLQHQQQIPRQQSFFTAVHPQHAPDIDTEIIVERALKRLRFYMKYQWQPQENNILYWRAFVRHYYHRQVKRITCFSKHDGSGNHVAQLEPWSCDVCGSKPGKGFVETYDVLPRMHEIYFNSIGVIDEVMALDFLIYERHPDGSLVLCFKKAVKESFYQHYRVVHEGKLRVVLTAQLQILSWVFCVQHHKVLSLRSSLASQEQNLSSNGNRVDDAAHKLASIVKQRVSPLGLSKYFSFSLQASEVLHSMKDLMNFSVQNKTSPIETLKLYGRVSMPQTACLSDQARLAAQNVHLTGKINHTFPTSNCMSRTQVGNKKATNNSLCRYQNPPLSEQMMPYNVPHQNIIAAPAQNIFDPNLERLALNDLLGRIQREGTLQKRCMQQSEEVLQGRAQKKSRLGYSQVNKEPETCDLSDVDGFSLEELLGLGDMQTEGTQQMQSTQQPEEGLRGKAKKKSKRGRNQVKKD